MEFVLVSWYVVVTIVAIVIGIFVAGFVNEEHPRYSSARYALNFLIYPVIMMFVANLLSVGATYVQTRDESPTDHHWISICEVTKQMGLESGRDYTAEVGARVGGSYGDGYFWSGIFTHGGSLHIQPGSALSVGFDYQGKSSIFELPLSKTTFVQSTNAAKPSIKLTLDCGRDDYDYDHLVGVSQVSHYTPARWRFDSGLFTLTHNLVSVDEPIPDNPNLVNYGLAPIVNDNLVGVTVTLSPELYAKILG